MAAKFRGKASAGDRFVGYGCGCVFVVRAPEITLQQFNPAHLAACEIVHECDKTGMFEGPVLNALAANVYYEHVAIGGKNLRWN